MADFVLSADIQIQNVLGLQAVRQQLSNVTAQLGSAGGLGNLVSQANNLNTAIGKASAGLNTFAQTAARARRPVQNTANTTKDAARAADNFGESVFIAGKRYAAFIVATSAAFQAAGAIREGTRAVIEFDQALVSLGQILDGDQRQLGRLSEQILNLSTTTGTSISEVSDLARVLSQAGQRGDVLQNSLDALAKVPLTPTFEDIGNATEGVLAALNQFTREGLEASDVLDKFTDVANNFAVTAEDLAVGVSKGGAAFEAIGGTLDEFVGAFAAVRQVTRESEATIGTFFKTLSSRLATSDIREFLQGRGISLVDQTGSFVGPIQALESIGAALENITNVQDRVDIANRIAGRRQVSRFLALVQNLDLVRDAIDTSANSTGAFDRVATQGLESINAQLRLLGETARRLAIELGEDLFIPVIRGLTAFGEAAITTLTAIKPLIPALTTLAGLFATGALARGFSAFVAPRIGQIGSIGAGIAAGGAARAGGAGAFGAARAGLNAGVGSIPFAQPSLTTVVGGALTSFSRQLSNAGTGVDGFATNLIQASATILAGLSLLRNQTAGQFLRGGGLLGASAGLLGGIGTVAVPALGIAAFQLAQEANRVARETIDAAIQGVREIELDASAVTAGDVRPLQDSLKQLFDKVATAANAEIERVDIRGAEGVGDFVARAINKASAQIGSLLEGQFENLAIRGGPGVNAAEVNAVIDETLNANLGLIKDISTAVGRALVDINEELNLERGDLVNLRQNTLQRIAIERLGREGGLALTQALTQSSERAELFRDTVSSVVDSLVREREVIEGFASAIIPQGLSQNLFQLSNAANEAATSLERSARVFDSQISLIQGIGAPSLGDVQFDTRELQRAVARGQFATILRDQPVVQEALQNFELVQSAFDSFVQEIGGIDPGILSSRGPGQVAEDFAGAINIPQELRPRLQEFFAEIAGAFIDEPLIDPNELQQRFDETFGDIRSGADGITEVLQTAIRGIFVGIEDELGRTSQIRQLELDAAITPQAQANFIQAQLQRAGVQGPRLTAQRNIPEFGTTVEDLQRERQRRLENETILRQFTAGDRIGGQAVLRQPGQAEIRGQGQNLAELVLDERTRGNLRQRFVDLTEQLTQARVRLEQLTNSGEGTTQTFFETAEEVRSLSGQLIEVQTAFEALGQATNATRQSELESLRVRQQADLEAFRARTFDRAAPGEAGQLRATRAVEDFQLEQQREQERLNRQFDEILQNDALTRVELARTIDQNTPRQEEAASLLNRGAVIFSDAVDRFREIRDIRPRQDATAVDEAQQQQQEQQQIVPALQEMIDNQRQTTEAQQQTNALQQQANEQAGQFAGFDDDTLKALVEINREAFSDLGSITEQNSEELKKNAELIRQLTEELNRRGTIKIETEQQVSVNVEGLLGETEDTVRPLLEEAGNQTARVAVINVLRSLAEKTDQETATAIQQAIGELA